MRARQAAFHVERVALRPLAVHPERAGAWTCRCAARRDERLPLTSFVTARSTRASLAVLGLLCVRPEQRLTTSHAPHDRTTTLSPPSLPTPTRPDHSLHTSPAAARIASEPRQTLSEHTLTRAPPPETATAALEPPRRSCKMADLDSRFDRLKLDQAQDGRHHQSNSSLGVPAQGVRKVRAVLSPLSPRLARLSDTRLALPGPPSLFRLRS